MYKVEGRKKEENILNKSMNKRREKIKSTA